VSADTELRDPASRVPTEAPDDVVVEPRSSRRRDAVIIVIALLVGMGAVAGYGALTRDDEPASSATVAPGADAELEPVAPAPAPETGGDVVPGAPAASPASAVGAFLAAEADGDFERSYALLTAAQRETYGSSARWTNAHADFFPITGHEVVAEGADRITTEVEYR
jgi:hypothetical protein